MPRSPVSMATQLTVHVSTQAVADLEDEDRQALQARSAARCGSSPSTSAAASARRRARRRDASPRSSSPEPPRRRSGSRSTGTRNCRSRAIGRRPKSRSRFCRARDGALKALSLTAYSDAGVAVNSTVAGARPSHLSGRSQGARRLRRRQQPAAGLRLPRPRRSADGLRARAGDRRGGAPAQDRPDPVAQALGPRPRSAAPLSTGPRARDVARARPDGRRRGRYRRGVGVADRLSGSISGSSGTKVELAIEDGRLVASTATQDIGTGTRSVIADTVAREFGLEPHEVEVRIGDSTLPEGPTSGGSRVTASIVPPLAARGRQAQSRHRRQDRSQAGAGIERAVARPHRRLARSQSRGGAPGGQRQDRLRQQSRW